MAGIGSWVFIIVGAAVASISYLLYEDLWVFVFIGAVFFFYGIAKAFITRSIKKKEEDRVMAAYGRARMPAAERVSGMQGRNEQYAADDMYRLQRQGYPAGPMQAPGHHNMLQPPPGQNPHAQNYPPIMTCRWCGSRLRLHDNFCPNCGRRVR